MDERTVQRNEDQSRYELVQGSTLIGIADFHAVNGALVLPHTEIDPVERGQGRGDELLRGLLDDVRRRGETVVPRCWFVRQYIDAHPEYQDLVAA